MKRIIAGFGLFSGLSLAFLLLTAGYPQPRVSGGLATPVSIANGGTGSTSQNFVDLTTTQSIAGAKSFSTSINYPNIAIAATGTVQGDAAAVTVDAVSVSSGGVNAGIILPVSTAGRIILVDNQSGNQIKVYPASGENFVGGAANAFATLPIGHSIRFYCASAGVWTTILASKYSAGVQTITPLTTFVSGVTFTAESTQKLGELIGIDATGNTTLTTGATLRGPTLVAGGTADQAGGTLTLSVSGKGAGTPGSILLQAPNLGSTGTALTTASTAFSVGGANRFDFYNTSGTDVFYMPQGVQTGPSYRALVAASSTSTIEVPLLTCAGATGTCNYQGPDNKAESFWIGESTNRYLATKSTDGAEAVVLSKALTKSTSTGLTATTSTCAAGNGTALTVAADFYSVSTITTTLDAVKLPACVIGQTKVIAITLLDATKTLRICPQVGGEIDSNVADTGYTLAGSATIPVMRHFDCIDGTTWLSY